MCLDLHHCMFLPVYLDLYHFFMKYNFLLYRLKIWVVMLKLQQLRSSKHQVPLCQKRKKQNRIRWLKMRKKLEKMLVIQNVWWSYHLNVIALNWWNVIKILYTVELPSIKNPLIKGWLLWKAGHFSKSRKCTSWDNLPTSLQYEQNICVLYSEVPL